VKPRCWIGSVVGLALALLVASVVVSKTRSTDLSVRDFTAYDHGVGYIIRVCGERPTSPTRILSESEKQSLHVAAVQVAGVAQRHPDALYAPLSPPGVPILENLGWWVPSLVRCRDWSDARLLAKVATMHGDPISKSNDLFDLNTRALVHCLAGDSAASLSEDVQRLRAKVAPGTLSPGTGAANLLSNLHAALPHCATT
jgi:hypothetical protein